MVCPVVRSCHCWQLLSTALLLAAAAAAITAAAAQPSTSSNGYISPPSKVPDFNPAVWNQAYKLTLRNVPASHSSKELIQGLRFPNTMLMGVQLPKECPKDGFDMASPSAAALGSCFSRPTDSPSGSPPGTVDYWVKLPGLALVNGNCYCYALDFFQGGYCYPGTKNGAVIRYRQQMTCKAMSDGVVGDGGEAVSRQQALSGQQPSSGHYIALMARPESCIKGHCYVADFHVMRKDSNGLWSWKHPSMPATNRDLFGALVTDPESAALLGSYQVCGYFRVEPQKMLHVDANSRKEPGPLPVNPALDKYRAMPGVKIEVAALPYNAATDAALTQTSQQALDDDTAWQRLRGTEQYTAWAIREKQALELLPRGVIIASNEKAASSMGGGSSSSSTSDGLQTGSPKRRLRLKSRLLLSS